MASRQAHPIKCDKCHTFFVTQSSYNKHRAETCGKYVCPNCNLQMRIRKDLQDHIFAEQELETRLRTAFGCGCCKNWHPDVTRYAKCVIEMRSANIMCEYDFSARIRAMLRHPDFEEASRRFFSRENISIDELEWDRKKTLALLRRLEYGLNEADGKGPGVDLQHIDCFMGFLYGQSRGRKDCKTSQREPPDCSIRYGSFAGTAACFPQHEIATAIDIVVDILHGDWTGHRGLCNVRSLRLTWHDPRHPSGITNGLESLLMMRPM